MLTQIIPEFGKNYDIGQAYFIYRTKSKLHSGIAWVTNFDKKDSKLEWGHCGIVISKQLGVEADSIKGVRYYNLNHYFNDPSIIIVFKEPRLLTDLTRWKIKYLSCDLVGHKYDWKLIFGFILRKFLPTKIFIDNFSDKEKFVCSEFVKHVYIEAGVSLDKKEQVSPNGLFNDNLFKEWKII